MHLILLSYYAAILVLLLPPIANAFLCERLVENNWESLISALEASGDFLIVCPPFEIKGDGCPRSPMGHVIPPNTSTTILCDQTAFGGGAAAAATSSSESPPDTVAATIKDAANLQQTATNSLECVLDCPGTHFTVKANAMLTIDGLAFRGARRPAIRIEQYGALHVFQTKFEINSFLAGNGGAIQAGENSRLIVNQCEFINNTALSGGAILAEGESIISFSNFVDNKALSATRLSGGGAIAIGVFAETTIAACGFKGNSAASHQGAAVLDHSKEFETVAQANAGCNNNNNMHGDKACNGIQHSDPRTAGGREDSCEEFEVTCPTEAQEESKQVPPSLAPSPTPTIDPCLLDKDSFECILHELLEDLP